jgi:HSP20 family molecular chaperone IbpA
MSLINLASQLFDEPEHLLLAPFHRTASDYQQQQQRLRDLDRLVASTTSAMARTDIEESATAYEITMDIPGISKEDLDISMRDHVLSVTGHRKRKSSESEPQSQSQQQSEKEATTASETDQAKSVKASKTKSKYIRSEIFYGDFTRSFTLPEDVDEDSVKAKCDNGVLTITVSKKAPKKDDGVKRIHLE